MTITNGTRLGPYEVLSAIGAGGMGEVYQAHDSKLGRDVAIKVLPEQFAQDPDRLARFQREAKMLAALNHPNIAAIYGLEQSGSTHYLVMELVPGETLAERIRGGAIPVDETLPIARQVADAVEYAHDKNVIHRDLKPANIKVTADGTVKVLDFGLAKALADDPAAEDVSNSPTLSMAATRQGLILGTAAYMSPEQAKGKVVDRRADVWAFGAVLYEMLTGKQLFTGDSIAETLAAVIKEEPALDNLPPSTPAPIRNLLRRCLDRNVRRRLVHIGEARIAIEDVLAGTTAAEPAAEERGKSRERLAWSAAAVLLVALLAAGTFAYFRPSPEAAKAVRFFISPPESWNLPPVTSVGGLASAPLAVSPDGQRIAFIAANAEGKSLIWLRSTDTLAAEPLTGTEGALSPFWSPDSRFLGFWAGGKLKKIAIAGGPPIVLCDASSFAGGAWSRDGVIVFAPTGNAALQKVSAAGGIPTPATTLGQGDVGHNRPFFLPDGRHFLYRSRTSTAGLGGPVYLASLDSAERKMLLSADTNNVLFSQGHLLFMRETSLMAQPFDTRRLELTGEPFPIAEQIQSQVSGEPYGVFSASENGMLAYQTGTAAGGSQLIWFDRTGKQTGVLGEAARYGDLDLSPDGTRATVALPDQAGKGHDIWLYDLARGLKTRFTFDPADEQTSRWSLDGSRVVFNSSRKGHYDLYLKASSGDGKEQLLLEDNLEKAPLDWSPDGRFLLYRSIGQSTSNDLWVLPLSGDRKPVPYLATKYSEANGHFSPDGRWVVYNSTESGRNEVYVAPFPGPGSKWQISTGGGDYPRWRHDGAEIFYLAPDNQLMVAAVNGKGSTFEAGVVKPLFGTRAAPGLRGSYAVSADGQRFLINTLPEQSRSAPITVVLNWTAGLKK